jgi:hypothetical protein
MQREDREVRSPDRELLQPGEGVRVARVGVEPRVATSRPPRSPQRVNDDQSTIVVGVNVCSQPFEQPAVERLKLSIARDDVELRALKHLLACELRGPLPHPSRAVLEGQNERPPSGAG